MKKYEYLSELEKRLSALPADARRDALNYYEEYFDAAGPDNEDATAAELGDPAEAARKILEGEGLTPDADPAAPESARGGAVPPAAPEPPAADPQPARPQKHGPGAKTMWLIFAVVIVAALLIQLGVLVLSFAKPSGGTASMVVAPTEEETAASEPCPHRGLLQRDRRHRGRGQRQPIGEDGFHHRSGRRQKYNLRHRLRRGHSRCGQWCGGADPFLHEPASGLVHLYQHGRQHKPGACQLQGARQLQPRQRAGARA